MQKEVLKALKQALLPRLSLCVCGNLTEVSGDRLAETVASLIGLCAEMKDVRDFTEKLPAALQNVEYFER